jgi:hypothetical protein
MRHKRRRPKNRRGGCLLCKPWKANGSQVATRQRISDARRMMSADAAVDDALASDGQLKQEEWVYYLFRVHDV